MATTSGNGYPAPWGHATITRTVTNACHKDIGNATLLPGSSQMAGEPRVTGQYRKLPIPPLLFPKIWGIGFTLRALFDHRICTKFCHSQFQTKKIACSPSPGISKTSVAIDMPADDLRPQALCVDRLDSTVIHMALVDCVRIVLVNFAVPPGMSRPDVPETHNRLLNEVDRLNPCCCRARQVIIVCQYQHYVRPISCNCTGGFGRTLRLFQPVDRAMNVDQRCHLPLIPEKTAHRPGAKRWQPLIGKVQSVIKTQRNHRSKSDGPVLTITDFLATAILQECIAAVEKYQDFAKARAISFGCRGTLGA